MKSSLGRNLAMLSVLFNLVMFHALLYPHIKSTGYWTTIVQSTGWEFPPFWPPYWTLFNILGFLGYAVGVGAFGGFDPSEVLPVLPALLFILGSAIQTYGLVKLTMFLIHPSSRTLMKAAPLKAWVTYITALVALYAMDYTLRILRAHGGDLPQHGMPEGLVFVFSGAIGLACLLVISRHTKGLQQFRRSLIILGHAVAGLLVYLVITGLYVLETGVDSF